MKVLVIDDHILTLRLISRILQKEGNEVVSIEHPKQVRAALEQGPFNVALVDVMLPDNVDGIELAKDLRNLRPSMKVISMSGVSANRDRARDEGFAFLSKPFTSEELCAEIV